MCVFFIVFFFFYCQLGFGLVFTASLTWKAFFAVYIRAMKEKEMENIVRELVVEYDSLSVEERINAGPLSVEELWRKAFQHCMDTSSSFLTTGMHQLQKDKDRKAASVSLFSSQEVGESTSMTLHLSSIEESHEGDSIIMRNVPTLYRFALLESRIFSKIYAALATRPVITIYELEREICLMEGVFYFSQLRLGMTLLEWPVIQTYFQCRQQKVVFPVTSEMFLQFVAHHPSAEQLRAGVGDVRDAMYGFRQYYEKEVLPTVRKAQESECSSFSLQSFFIPSCVHNIWALGIYVQRFPDIIASIRQEAAIGEKQRSFAAQLCDTSKALQQKLNIPFYQKVLLSLDSAMMKHEFVTEPLSFSVQCSEEELSSFVLPQSCRRIFRKENLPEGGYRINFRINHEESTSAPSDFPSCSTTIEKTICLKNVKDCIPSFVSGTQSSDANISFQMSNIATSSVSNSRRRLKKGMIISDCADSVSKKTAKPWRESIAPRCVNNFQVYSPSRIPAGSVVVEDHSSPFTIPVEVNTRDIDTQVRLEMLSATEKKKIFEEIAKMEITVSQCLQLELDKKEQMDGMRVITLLSQLQPDSIVDLSLLILAFESLSGLPIVVRKREKLRKMMFIPLISAIPCCRECKYSVPLSSATSRCSASTHFVRVEEMASPFTLCWSFKFSTEDVDLSELVGDDNFVFSKGFTVNDIKHDDSSHFGCLQKYFRRNLDQYYPLHLRNFFVYELFIFPSPSVATWICTWRRLSAEVQLDANMEVQYLNFFSRCVVEELFQRIDRSLPCSKTNSSIDKEIKTDENLQTAATNSLNDLLHDLPSSVCSQSFLFPAKNRWWRGVDGLFACGPRYVGCNDLYFQPSGNLFSCRTNETDNTLLCLKFKEEIHFAVEAVLQRCGVKLIHRAVTFYISMEYPMGTGGHHDASKVAASLHAIMETILPCVHLYLRSFHPVLYALSEEEIRRRLASVRFLLGFHIRLIEQLADPFSEQNYTLSQSPRLRYVPSHNAIYGPIEKFSSPVLAEVLCDFFLPLTPVPSTRLEFCAFLRSLLSKVFDADGERVPESILHSLMESEKRNIESILVCKPSYCSVEMQLAKKAPKLLKENAVVPWEIVRPPSRVQRWKFPPGEDVMGSGILSLTLLQEKKSVNSACSFDKTKSPSGKESVFTESSLTATRKRENYGYFPQQWSSLGKTIFSNPHELIQELSSPSTTQVMHDSFSSNTTTLGRSNSSLKLTPTIPGLKRYRDNDENVIDRDFFTRGQVNAVTLGEKTSNIRSYSLEAEKFVWKELTERFSFDHAIRVVWLNEVVEKGEPYDVVVFREGKNGNRTILYFIEVKSTSSCNRRDFELSLRELLFAARYGSAFHVHRVFNASTNDLRKMRVEEYSDLITLWQKGQLTLTGDVHVVPPILASNKYSTDP